MYILSHQQVKNELLPYENGIFQNHRFLSAFAYWFCNRDFATIFVLLIGFQKRTQTCWSSMANVRAQIAGFLLEKTSFHKEQSATETRVILFAKIHTFSDKFLGFHNNQIIWLKK